MRVRDLDVTVEGQMCNHISQIVFRKYDTIDYD